MNKDIVAVVLVPVRDGDPVPVGLIDPILYAEVATSGELDMGGVEPVPVLSARYLDKPISREELRSVGNDMIATLRRRPEYQPR